MDDENVEITRLLLDDKRSNPILREGFLKYLLVVEFTGSAAFKGFTTVLALFILETLHFTETGTAEIVHLLLFACFAASILGSICSDGCLGSYYSFLVFSILQVVGYSLLTVTSISESGQNSLASTGGNAATDLLAVALIGVGAGASKTSFCTFVCDEAMLSLENRAEGKEISLQAADIATTAQKLASEYFLAIILVATRCGDLVYNFLTPEVRVQSGGTYFYVFLLIAVTKAIGTFAFWMGRHEYHFNKSLYGARKCENGLIDKPQNGEKHKEIGQALAEETTMLLDLRVEAISDPKARTVEDWKILGFAVLALLPLAFYLALITQTMTTWVFQARHMDGHVIGNWTIPPDQMPTFGGIFVLICIPLLETVIWPLVSKYLLELTSLRKLLISLTMATLAFVLSGFLQIAIDSRLQETTAEYADISILWQIPQYVSLAFGEAIFGIAVVHFAYHEAPHSMKSSVNGIVNVFLGSGNLITVAVLAILGPNVANNVKCFVFAGVGCVGFILLAFVNYFYVTRQERALRKQKETQSNAKSLLSPGSV